MTATRLFAIDIIVGNTRTCEDNSCQHGMLPRLIKEVASSEINEQ